MASIVKKTNSNRILFYVFILAVFVDAANGILQKKVGITTPIGIMYRGTLFYYLFLYLFKSKYKTLIGLLIFLVLICLFCWVAFYNAIVPKEIEYLIRYSYFFVFLNFFCLKRNCFDAESVYKHILIYGLLISTIIIFCYFTGFGIKSYGEGEYGWGEKGLFIATNDIGLTIICSLICSCIYQQLYRRNKWTLLCIVIISAGGILVGSRVCFGFIPFTLFLFALYKGKKTRNKFIVLLAGALIIYVVVYVGIQIYSMLDNYALAKLTKEGFESARTILTDEAKKHISNFDVLSMCIGEGAYNLHLIVGKGLGIDEERAVEADYYEIIGSYGYLLGGIVLLSYLKIAYNSVKHFFMRVCFESFEFAYLCLSFIVIAFFAGHAVTNMMATPILAYVASRLLQPQRKIVYTGQNE